MRQWSIVVDGQKRLINRVEIPEDLEQFRNFIRRNLRALGVDTEATGLDIYSDTFRLRTVQFGNKQEAWVIPVELGPVFQDDARKAIKGIQQLIFHNASFDIQVLSHHMDFDLSYLWAKTLDTKVLAHLVDSRGREEGGTGHSLEDLVRQYVDEEQADKIKGLMAELAKKYKTTKSKIWAVVDLNEPDYNIYAGADCIFVSELASRLGRMVPISSRGLVRFEHEVAEICSIYEKNGFLLDTEYTQKLSVDLEEKEADYKRQALAMGCENVNSTDQVAEVLLYRGVLLTEKTKTGKWKVDKNVLDELVKAGDKFATAVVEAKRAGKWRSTWVDGFLANRDSQDRCHASINSLRARTARMSITGIPAQTLPSGDWMIRRCFIADEGHLIGSVDYQAQELRVLAALSGDPTMIQAFRQGLDLHLITAQAAFGEHITKDSVERKYAKTVNFGRVYGGGAATVALQTGLDIETAKRVVEAFDKRYPGVTRLSKSLAREAMSNGFITTPSGRRLYVDRSRGYSALNYMVQSTSRDVTCRGLVKLHKAGYTPYIRLPVHDEVVASFPAAKAEWGAGQVAELMKEQMGPVSIDTDAEVGLRSWGSLYGATA